MVRSYNDPAKQKARQRLLVFIKKHLKVKPETARVLCFPGAEVQGEEALEVTEIYDRLGIPRENIVGLEYNREAARRLKRANFGIEVICQDAYTFFQTTKKHFDVISLDYTGQRTWRERDTTRYIAGRNVLNNFGIFCTNHMVKREGSDMKSMLLEQLVFDGSRVAKFDAKSTEEMFRERFDVVDQFAREYNHALEVIQNGGLNLDILRYAITKDNICIFSGGRNEINPQFQVFMNNPRMGDLSQKKIPDGLTLPKLVHKNRGLITRPGYGLHRARTMAAQQNVIVELNKRGFTPEQSYAIVVTLSMDFTSAYIPTALKQYSYTSNKNAKMLFDIMSFQHLFQGTVERAKEIITVQEDGNIRYNPFKYNRKELKRRAQKLVEQLNEHTLMTVVIDTPVYLGSSWVPPKRKERISKADAVELMKSGCTPKEIADTYKGFSKMQLAGFKAHYVTMGKEL